MTLNLTAGSAIGASDWTNPLNAVDGNTATFAASSGVAGNNLELINITDVSDPTNAHLGNPEMDIHYVNVLLRLAKVSGPDVAVNVTLEDNSGPISATYSVTITSTSPSDFNIKIPCKPTGESLDRKDIWTKSIKVVINANAGTAYRVYHNVITLEYSINSDLFGSTSSFPFLIDTINTVTNSNKTVLDANDVIQSTQLTKLGDSIITLQKVLDLDGDTLSKLRNSSITIGKKAQGFSDIFLLTYILRGTRLSEYFGLFYREYATVPTINFDYTNIHVGQTNTKSDVPIPGFEKRILFPIVSGMGWVDNTTYLPLHVSPQIIGLVNDTGTISYSVGFRCYPANADTWDTNFTSTSGPTFDPYTGYTDYTGSHPFEIRIMAIGLPVS